ncbi:MAG: hypothetical protein H6Q41_4022, partial [Deltaproteobacteria bacterium]|nr:hypothetical protein [Deltaproteobacteria bacterium]
EPNKGIGKIHLNLLVWTDYPAIGERRLVAADNDEINLLVILESFKFAHIPSGLFSDLFLG